MVDTPNLGLQRPANGSFVNTWDQPINSNWGLVDTALGANAAVALSNVPVVLSSGQYGCAFITFTGTLTADVRVSFPSGIGRLWYITNDCAGTGSFSAMTQVSSNNRYVAIPPNETIGVISDGTDMKFVGIARVGSYMDFAGTAVPLWISASNPPPYLNCDGTTFSSAIYPALRDYLGTTTLPDARGRFRATLDQGQGRLTGASSLGGLNAQSSGFLLGGGAQLVSSANLPNYNLTVTDPTHAHGYSEPQGVAGYSGAGPNFGVNAIAAAGTSPTATGISVALSGGGHGYAPPSYVGGLTLIRAG